MLELGVERLGLGLVDEVAVLAAPGRDRVDDAVGDLAQRALTLDRTELPPEVLLGHDVGGVLRPADGELDARLLERHCAVPEVADAGVPPLPQDLVVRIDVRGGEVAADPDARLLRGDCHREGSFSIPIARPEGLRPQYLVGRGIWSPEMRGTFHHRNYTGVKRCAPGKCWS